MDRIYVEKILKLNGLSETDDRSKIETFFTEIHWNKEDIDKACELLEQPAQSSRTTDESIQEHKKAHKGPRGEDMRGYDTVHYGPDKIQSLLNITLDASSLDFDEQSRNSRKNISLQQMLMIVVLTFIFTCAALMAVYWHYDIDFLTYFR